MFALAHKLTSSTSQTTANDNLGLRLVRGNAENSGRAISYSSTLPANGIKSYTFDGTAGQAFQAYASGTYGSSIIYVYNPDGSVWTYAYDRFSGTLPSTGTYTVTVTGYYNSYNGAYNLYYVRGASTVSEGSLISGQSRTGTLPANGIKSYTFTATASTNLTVSTTFGTYRYLYVYNPDGSLWTYSAAQPFSYTLPAASGDYTIAFVGYYPADTGAYTITATVTQPSIPSSTPQEVEATPSCDPTDCSCQGADTAVPTIPTTSTGNPTTDTENGAVPFTGSPMNFDVGFKALVQTDYDAAGLTFSRIYRSDSTWTNI